MFFYRINSLFYSKKLACKNIYLAEKNIYMPDKYFFLLIKFFLLPNFEQYLDNI